MVGRRLELADDGLGPVEAIELQPAAARATGKTGREESGNAGHGAQLHGGIGQRPNG